MQIKPCLCPHVHFERALQCLSLVGAENLQPGVGSEPSMLLDKLQRREEMMGCESRPPSLPPAPPGPSSLALPLWRDGRGTLPRRRRRDKKGGGNAAGKKLLDRRAGKVLMSL